ncbi:putative ZIP zinc transporter [Ascodesmis nigricans]|uniref:Putative ZIP zinc transporter n=1 Tax=Ascodesmis nigricans TaxID=341454 RepID=A0A4S2N7Y7_9PEZI|nr:putative ZIP zinc transporter [Ascodesmis nigricans]
MAHRNPRLRLLLLLAAAVALAATVFAKDSKPVNSAPSLLSLTTAELDEKLQECPFVQDLNHERLAAQEETSSLMKRIFAIMFPAGPAINSLLATAYISGPPNFILALCPENIDPSSLSVMVAFAIGGLLGDTLLHLIPQTFMGEPHDARAHFVLNDPDRNAILGLFIFIGFLTFVIMDKTLRIITGGSHEHGHSHPHSHDITPSAKSSGHTSGNTDNLKSRKKGTSKTTDVAEKEEPAAPEIKPSSILNLVSDFTHNITDGLAMSGAFYSGPTVGAGVCIAVMLHEIPHEIGDFALLIQGGFTKWQAMGAQFITALGAFTGTIIGIAIQEFSKRGDSLASGAVDGAARGLFGTDLTAGDLVLPWTAGTFLYVGFSSLPEILETGKNRREEIRKSLTQLMAMAAGFAVMFFISD